MAPRDALRLRRIEDRIKKLEAEKRELIPKTAAMNPPVLPIPDGGVEKFRGAAYSTWFKAMGSFSNAQDWDSYAQMQNLLDEEMEELEAPSAFYSTQILGRVKWPGIKPRMEIIDRMNEIGGWGGDFRDIYPKWEYVYRIVESIGGVPVRFYEHKAKMPLAKRDLRNGWKGF